MAPFVKFFDFVDQLCQAKHDFSASGHIFKVYATNATPDQTADAIKADLAEIAAGNGYPAGGSDIQNTLSETSGTATVGATDVVWTASGGAFPSLRYIVLYNDTHASDALCAYWDYGSSVVVQSGESFTWDTTGTVFTIA